MEHNRHYTRHPVSLKVELFGKSGWQPYVTADISRVGLFVCIASPNHSVGSVVQLRIQLPDGSVLDLMARVRRVVAAPGPGGMNAGIGLEFFAISQQLRDTWSAFVTSLRRPAPRNFAEDSQDLRAMAPPKVVREMLRKMREAGELVQAPALQIPGAALPPAVVPVQPANLMQLALLAERCGRGAALFLRTSHVCQQGQTVHVVLCHPETDEEWTAQSTVERQVTDDSGGYVGVQVRFVQPGERDRRALAEFVRGVGAMA